jgi:hypothetical protein
MVDLFLEDKKILAHERDALAPQHLLVSETLFYHVVGTFTISFSY